MRSRKRQRLWIACIGLILLGVSMLQDAITTAAALHMLTLDHDACRHDPGDPRPYGTRSACRARDDGDFCAVSYTHLTLPTICSV